MNLPEGWTSRKLFEDWFIDDPDGQPIEKFRAARDEIKQRVQELLQSQKALTSEQLEPSSSTANDFLTFGPLNGIIEFDDLLDLRLKLDIPAEFAGVLVDG